MEESNDNHDWIYWLRDHGQAHSSQFVEGRVGGSRPQPPPEGDGGRGDFDHSALLTRLEDLASQISGSEAGEGSADVHQPTEVNKNSC